jgi:hypothetical protein
MHFSRIRQRDGLDNRRIIVFRLVSIFWCDRIEWPWNGRGCETSTELLPCECVMRRPIASLFMFAAAELPTSAPIIAERLGERLELRKLQVYNAPRATGPSTFFQASKPPSM